VRWFLHKWSLGRAIGDPAFQPRPHAEVLLEHIRQGIAVARLSGFSGVKIGIRGELDLQDIVLEADGTTFQEHRGRECLTVPLQILHELSPPRKKSRDGHRAVLRVAWFIRRGSFRLGRMTGRRFVFRDRLTIRNSQLLR